MSKKAKKRIRAHDPTPRMQEIIQSFVAEKTFMGAVLVVKGKKTLIDQGYGFADLEWDVPNTPSVKFRIGSITKQFTAACILLLEERGLLKVEEPAKKYLPDAPAAWDKVTLHNLLTHSSGIPNYTSFADNDTAERIETYPAQLVSRFIDKPLEFEAGTKFNYSNSGYVLLGFILEKICGQSYREFLERNIFIPLGMSDSGVEDEGAILPKRAMGYEPSHNGAKHALYLSMTTVFSAGALYSTTGDMLKWVRGLFGGKVLTPASLTKMTTPFMENYALGLFVENRKGRRVIHHGGDINGFSGIVTFYPDDKITVIILGNLNCLAPGQIDEYLGKIALGQEAFLPCERKLIEVSHGILEEYAGRYEIIPTFFITITVEDGRLISQGDGQPKVQLFAASETKFFLNVVSAEIEFVRDPVSGAVTHFTLYQNFHVLNGKRHAG